MNTSLATALLTNLMKNAFIHSVDNGEIEVFITADTFTITNRGGAQPLDKNLIFERFHQGAKKEAAAGSGLAIVDAICKFYKLQLSYTYTEDIRHCFGIKKLF